MTIAAIPTKYRGVQYRSRLEARWAAMFDLLGWEHEYEPIDLLGWIPDFRLHGPSGILVEVTPAEFLKEHREKMFAAGAPDASLHYSDPLSDWTWFATHDSKPRAAVCVTETCFTVSTGVRRDSDAALYEMSKSKFGNLDAIKAWILADWNYPALPNAWKEAGNRVQWKGAGATP